MIGSIRKFIILCFLTACSSMLNAQSQSISLDSCYVLAKRNYPLIKKYGLIVKSNEYSLENIAKGFLPQINLTGQASYQSDVTTFPKSIPGVPILSKDQYKIYAEVNQPIYDGGIIKEQKKIQEASSMADRQQLEVELYKLKDRINQLYFGILLINEQLKQNALAKNDIQLGIDKVNAQIANGIALRSNASVLKAELLKAGQQTIELKFNRKALIDILELFVHKSINETSVFDKPPVIISPIEIKRPELSLFDSRSKILDEQNNLITAQNNPKLSFFAQGGFGKPAFNILSNDFDPFYIGGLRLSFPLTGFYTVKNNRSLINIKKQNINIEKETFLFNTQFTLKQQNADITKLQQFLKLDDEIIPLRENVKKAALAQLENGVINSGDYLREVNAEDNARQTKILHEIQLLLAQYKVLNTTGN
jgi:outer membrane protein TolC